MLYKESNQIKLSAYVLKTKYSDNSTPYLALTPSSVLTFACGNVFE